MVSESQSGDQNHLRNVYDGLQSELLAGLRTSRTVIDHPGAKGSGAEDNWLRMLQSHLPSRYQAESAFVLDSDGTQSQQIDIVIFDCQYTPALLSAHGQKIVPAESVYAVLEVKPVLDKANVEYAAEKVSSVRRLARTSARIVHAGGEHEPRPLTPILGGILASDGGWNPVFGDPFQESIRKQDGERRLDLGCVANSGGFAITWGDGDQPELQTSAADHALAFFFLTLLDRLQRVGTVPAMDYQQYLQAFEQ